MLDWEEPAPSARPRLQNVVALEVLESVAPELLLRFLRPYAAYLADRGITLDDVRVDFDWIEVLHAVLTDMDPSMPHELQQALVDVGDLVGETGHEDILQAAGDLRVDLLEDQEHPISSVDLAFKVYLEKRDVFLRALARTRATTVKRFVEHCASANARLPLTDYGEDGPRVARLQAKISAWFANKNQTAYVRVIVTPTADDVAFTIIHGRPPRSHGVIEDQSRRRLSYVADKHDLAVYHFATGRLSVHAQFRSHQDLFRRVLGEVFFDDKEHFRVRDIFTGEPLLARGRAALSPCGVTGLHHVLLRELTLTAPCGSRVMFQAHDAMLDFEGVRELWKNDTSISVNQMKFELTFAESRRRPVLVEVVVPNKLVFDRRRDPTPIRLFLERQGFQRSPWCAA